MNRWIGLLAVYVVVQQTATNHEPLFTVRNTAKESYVYSYFDKETAEDMAEALNEAHANRTHQTGTFIDSATVYPVRHPDAR